MAKMEIFWRELNKSYSAKVRTFPLYSGRGFGFKFYPVDGKAITCKVAGESNEVVDRVSLEVIGEYNPAERHIVITKV